MIKLNQLPSAGNKTSKRLGRGIGSGKGKTAGRGVKGQKSRSGVSIKWFEGGQTPLIKRLPKRGFNAFGKARYVAVNLKDILLHIEKIGAEKVVDQAFLLRAGIIKKPGKIKLLAGPDISVPLTFDLDFYSGAVRDKIIAAGGSIKDKK